MKSRTVGIGDRGDLDSDRLTSWKMERDTKIENIALYIKNLTRDAEALKQKSSHLQRDKAAENS